MKNRHKTHLLTTMFMAMLLSILYIISTAHPEAWRWYGIVFGTLGVACFTAMLDRWIGAGR